MSEGEPRNPEGRPGLNRGSPARGLAPTVAVLVTLAVLAAMFVVDKKFFASVTPPPGVTLTDIRGVDQLRTRFDADEGTTRLILVLSPT